VAVVDRSLAEVPLKLLVVARLEVGETVWRVVLQAVVKLKLGENLKAENFDFYLLNNCNNGVYSFRKFNCTLIPTWGI
jgi:hypothetical protein